MASSNTVQLFAPTSFVTNSLSTSSLSYTNLFLTSNPLGRVLYIKEASEIPGPSVLSVEPSTTTYIQGSTMLFLQSNAAMTIQSYSATSWSLLGGYTGTNTFSTQQLPVNSVIVNPSFTESHLFVDLRTQSKTIVLPPIESISSLSSFCPYYTIKDLYGYAATSTLYISCSVTNTLERSSINNSLKLATNFASIDLVANPVLSKWHILNYYDGSLVAQP